MAGAEIKDLIGAGFDQGFQVGRPIDLSSNLRGKAGYCPSGPKDVGPITSCQQKKAPFRVCNIDALKGLVKGRHRAGKAGCMGGDPDRQKCSPDRTSSFRCPA